MGINVPLERRVRAPPLRRDDMWFFKSKPKMTTEEYAATRPPAPCGNQKEHVFWTELQGWPCPVCVAIDDKAKKEREENQMAEKIAAAVIRQMDKRSNGGVQAPCAASCARSPGTKC